MQPMRSQRKTGFFYFEGLGQWAVPQINSAGKIRRMIASSYCGCTAGNVALAVRDISFEHAAR
jgi:hypothetical protein